MDWIQPMEPIASPALVTGEGWIHQIKWDGVRGLVYYWDGKYKLFTKKGRDRTLFYPELSDIGRLIKGRQVVLDGEMVILDSEGKPAFPMSLVREQVRNPERAGYYMRKYPVVYVLFDILALNGENLTDKPLTERLAILRDTVRHDHCVAVTDDFTDGNGLFGLMKKKGWEGIVTKQVQSRYISGKKHRLWFKTKVLKKMLAVVWGIQWKDGFPNSLVLGIYRDEKPLFAGKASTGLTQKDLSILKEYAFKLAVSESPFPELAFKEKITWLKPALTCWVSFLEWTEDGVTRHPKILGFSSRPPNEAVGREYGMDE